MSEQPSTIVTEQTTTNRAVQPTTILTEPSTTGRLEEPPNFTTLSPSDTCNAEKCSQHSRLFMSRQQVEGLLTYRYLEEAYKIEKVDKVVSFEGVCLNEWAVKIHRYTSHLPKCRVSKRGKRNPRQNPCCETEMSMAFLTTVSSIFSSDSYNVTHYGHSYQLIHQGTCKVLNSRCSKGGFCKEVMRLQWVLVDKKAQSTFVPVLIPNHCACQYY